MGYEEFSAAMIKRSLRAVKMELEFLRDSSAITSQQYNSIVNNLPQESALETPAASVPRAVTPQPTPVPAPVAEPAPTPVANNPEKNGFGQTYFGTNNNNAPPPAYPSAPAPSVATLTHATALYQYNQQDAGDLAIMPNDRIGVTEYMNAEWWKGRNERTGAEGIFPRSYVRVEADRAGPVVPVYGTPQPYGAPVGPPPTNYGNVPLDVSQGGQGQTQPAPGEPNKAAQMGKKFGKKLGNATIFGAGATIGSNIVNGIF